MNERGSCGCSWVGLLGRRIYRCRGCVGGGSGSSGGVGGVGRVDVGADDKNGDDTSRG